MYDVAIPCSSCKASYNMKGGEIEIAKDITHH